MFPAASFHDVHLALCACGFPVLVRDPLRAADWLSDVVVRAQIKAGALRLLALLAKAAPTQLAAELPTIVPAVSECMYDAKQQVKVRVSPCPLGTVHAGGQSHVYGERVQSSAARSPPTEAVAHELTHEASAGRGASHHLAHFMSSSRFLCCARRPRRWMR